MNLEKLKKAREAKKPKLLYECFDYIIEEIPHNYRATIKCAKKPEEMWRGIDRDTYTHPEHGLDLAKKTVEDMISCWFLSGVEIDVPPSMAKARKSR